MTEDDLRSVPPDELVEAYAEAAASDRLAIESGNGHAAGRAAEVLVAIDRELRRRGPSSHRLLVPLLQSGDEGVRLWAATHVLEVAPDEAIRVLEALASGVGLVAFSAKAALREWRGGTLQFP